MQPSIDLVLPWVDGNDPAWQQEKAQVLGTAPDGGTVRYRDWDNLHFLFRSIETCLPFVRTVHFVTWGHLPPWLNTDCEKLHIVNHRDYIPSEYLPTFSSHTIELNFHRIEGLADRFIYANDDMFFLQPLTEEFFFRNGLPVDVGIESPHRFSSGDIDHITGNDLALINKHFDKKEALKQNRRKWFSPSLGKGLLKNLYLSPFACFTGFYDPHIPFAYEKRSFEAVWNAEPERLHATCSHRLRSIEDVNQWVCRYWQLASGNYSPAKGERGTFFSIGRDNPAIADAITHRKHPMICLNDDDPHLDFDREKETLRALLQSVFPEKSSFER